MTASLPADGVYLFAYHHDGTRVGGFPVRFPVGWVNTFPVIGDIDGDGAPEIVVVAQDRGRPLVQVLSAEGKIKCSMIAEGEVSCGTAPALADLDGDAIPEIIVQTNQALNV